MNVKLLEMVEKQINSELYNAYLYMSMSVWAKSEDWDGFAHWMLVQAKEEYNHAITLVNQVLERGEHPKLIAIQAPPTNWGSLLAMMEDTYNAELATTKAINAITEYAVEIKDHAFYEFILMYVKEQVEEESSSLRVVTDLKRIGNHIGAIYQLDKVLAQRVYDPPF